MLFTLIGTCGDTKVGSHKVLPPPEEPPPVLEEDPEPAVSRLVTVLMVLTMLISFSSLNFFTIAVRASPLAPTPSVTVADNLN